MSYFFKIISYLRLFFKKYKYFFKHIDKSNIIIHNIWRKYYMGRTKLRFFMKRVAPIILILTMILSLTGCMRMGIGINVHENETIDFGITMAVSSSMGDMTGSKDNMGINEENITQLKTAGYDVEEYNNDGYSGYTIIKKDVPFNEINSCLDSLNNLGNKIEEDMENSGTSMNSMMGTGGLSITKNDDIYTFSVEGIQNRTSGDTSEDTSTSSDSMGNMDMSAMLAASGGFVRLTLTLPDAPINHNADEVKENEDKTQTLTWDLLKTRDDDKLWATFQLKKPFPIKTIIIIAVIVFVIFVIFIILLLFVLLPMLKKNGNGVQKEKKQIPPKNKNNNKFNNKLVKSQDIAKEPCKWCTGIEDANIRIQYCGINGKNRIVSYDREKGMVIYGIAEYCPSCGRKINYKDASE